MCDAREMTKMRTCRVIVDFAVNVGRQLNEQHGKNKGKIERLWDAYTVVCVLIGLQVLAWGAAAV